jgi:uncharacterized protein YbjT (DUF2867 family)
MTLLLVGATGLVGREVLRLALADPRVGHLVAPTRRPLTAHPRLTNPPVDFDALPPDAPWWQADAVICTLGSTIRKAGSREVFRRIDHDYPLAVARLAHAHGARSFALTSSTGAHPAASSFYLRTKGALERDLEACGFASLTLVRPSLIGGRRDESRPAERLAMLLMTAFRPLIPRRYRMVPAASIARTLLEAALAANPGRHAIESEEIDIPS